MLLEPEPPLCSEEAAGCSEGTEPRRGLAEIKAVHKPGSEDGVKLVSERLSVPGRQRETPRCAPPASPPRPPPLAPSFPPSLRPRPRLAPRRRSLSHSSRCFPFLPRLPLLCPAGPAAGRNSRPVRLLPARPPRPWLRRR